MNEVGANLVPNKAGDLQGEDNKLTFERVLHQEGVDTSTPEGKALFQMLGVFAEFERAMIVE